MLVAQGSSVSVLQNFWWKKERWVGRTWLASYEGDAAAERFRAFEEGRETCETLVGRTPEGRVDSRISVGKVPGPKLGDEAVAFELSMDGPDGGVPTDRHVMVRVGSLTVDASDRGLAGAPPRFPLDVVVHKQVERLVRLVPLVRQSRT
ncbi:hypothetical protein ACOBQB_22725 [Streptomyces sp. G5(2025)]|uniref:hypothetical protein n=1 Tax=Streptomyces sp. G5(2025) TaxID=3406628 RepID=UPI003C25BF7B